MFDQVKSVLSLLTSSGILRLAGGLQGLLIYIRAGEEGFDTLSVAMIGVGWAVGFIAGSIYMPALVKKVGHIRSYSVMAAVGAIAMLLNLSFIYPYVWVILRAVSGFAFAGAFMITESWLNENATNETRGAIFSNYQIVSLAATMLGFLLIAIGNPSDDFLFIFGAILFCLALIPTALSGKTQPKPMVNSKVDLREIFRTSPIAAVGCLLVGVGNGAFGGLSAQYGQLIGLSAEYISYFMVFSVATSIFSQKPFGKLSDKIDRRIVIAIVAALSTISSLMIYLLDPKNEWMIIALIGLYGAFMYAQWPVLVAHANDRAKSGTLVTTASGLLLYYGIGTIFGPIFAGLYMEQFGAAGLFLFNAMVHGMLVFYALARMQIRDAQPIEKRRKFRYALPGRLATPQAARLAPKPKRMYDDVQ